MENNIYNSLKVFSPVIVRPEPRNIHPTWSNKNFRYDGTVKTIKEHYINRGAKHFGKERNVYVGFLDNSAYNNILLQGSKIMCYIHNNLLNCYIIKIVKDASSAVTHLEVAIYDDENIYNICNTVTYNIDISMIDSMLITKEGYNVRGL